MVKKAKILVIVPCYNEALSLPTLQQYFMQCHLSYDVLVIDDGSTDNTAQIAAEWASVVQHKQNQGLAAAIKTGLTYALEKQYDYCIQIDGDGQHLPQQIEKFLPFMHNNAPLLLLGSRYCDQKQVFGDARRLAGLLLAIQIYVLFGQWVWDAFSGMRMMNKAAMTLFVQLIDDKFIDTLLVPIALQHHLQLQEIGVQMKSREHGQSYIAGWKGVRFFLRLVVKIMHIKYAQNRVPQNATVSTATKIL